MRSITHNRLSLSLSLSLSEKKRFSSSHSRLSRKRPSSTTRRVSAFRGIFAAFDRQLERKKRERERGDIPKDILVPGRYWKVRVPVKRTAAMSHCSAIVFHGLSSFFFSFFVFFCFQCSLSVDDETGKRMSHAKAIL